MTIAQEIATMMSLVSAAIKYDTHSDGTVGGKGMTISWELGMS